MKRSAVRSQPAPETVHLVSLTQPPPHVDGTVLSKQSLPISLVSRCHRRFTASAASPTLSQPVRPLLQRRRRRLRPPPIQRTHQRRRSLVRSLTMGEVGRVVVIVSSLADAHPLAPRLLGFGACLIGACVCFFFAFLGLPWLPLRPAKFALAFRFDSSLPFVFMLTHSSTQLGKSSRHGRAS